MWSFCFYPQNPHDTGLFRDSHLILWRSLICHRPPAEKGRNESSVVSFWWRGFQVATASDDPLMSQHKTHTGPCDQENWFWEVYAAELCGIQLRPIAFLASFKEWFFFRVHNPHGRTQLLPTSCYANSAPASPTALLSAETKGEKQGLLLRYTWSGKERAVAYSLFPIGTWRL